MCIRDRRIAQIGCQESERIRRVSAGSVGASKEADRNHGCDRNHRQQAVACFCQHETVNVGVVALNRMAIATAEQA